MATRKSIEIKLLFKGVTILSLLFSTFTTIGQTFYDSGNRDEGSSYLRYNQGTDNYELLSMSYNGIRKFDSTTVFQRLTIDRQLSLIKRDTLRLPKSEPFWYYHIQGIESVSSHVVMGQVYPQKTGFLNEYLGKWQICELGNDSIKDCITFTPDSAYGVLSGHPWLKPGVDTIYTVAAYATSRVDTFRDQYLVKVDTSSGTVTRKKTELFHNGARVSFISKPARTADGDLAFVCVAEENNPPSFYGGVAVVDPQLDSVLSFTKINTPISQYYSLWVRNNKAVVFFRGSRASPTPNPNFNYYDELCLEIVNLTKDTLTTKHFFALSPPNPYSFTQDISGPASYFDGEHFILPGTLNTTPLASTNRFKTMMIGVDTSYNIIERDSITDNTNTYYGVVWSIIPEPDSAGNFIYAGLVQGDQIAPPRGNVNAFWSKFRINDSGVGMKELLSRADKFDLYPNPNSGEFKLCGNEELETCNTRIINPSGTVVYEGSFTTECERLKLDLPPGTFILELKAKSYQQYFTIVIH